MLRKNGTEKIRNKEKRDMKQITSGVIEELSKEISSHLEQQEPKGVHLLEE